MGIKIGPYRGYSGELEYSYEDSCWCGKVITGNKDLILFETDNEDPDAGKYFMEAVDDWLENRPELIKEIRR